jgi:hypothetical protein
MYITVMGGCWRCKDRFRCMYVLLKHVHHGCIVLASQPRSAANLIYSIFNLDVYLYSSNKKSLVIVYILSFSSTILKLFFYFRMRR